MFTAVILFGIVAVAAVNGEQRTNADLKACLKAGKVACREQCRDRVPETIRAATTACFETLEAERKTQMEGCTECASHMADPTAACWTLPAGTEHPYRRHLYKGLEDLGTAYPQLADSVTCHKECTKTKAQACHDGCTGTMPSGLTGENAHHHCWTSTPTDNFKACLNTAGLTHN